MKSALCIILSTAMSAFLGGQNGKSGLGPPASPSIDLRTERVVFSTPPNNSPLDLPSVAMNGPPVCGADGRAFFQFLTNAPYYNKRNLYSITDDGDVVRYPVERIPGLTDPWIISSDPGTTTAVILFHAKTVGQDVHSSAPYHIALFDYDGELRADINIDVGFEPVQAMQLSDDRYLVIGYDSARGVPKFVILNRGGTVVSDMGMSFMPSAGELKGMFDSMNFVGANPNDLPLSQKAIAALSLFHAVHSAAGLLLLEPGAGARVIEIPATGESRVLKIKLPPNQVAQSLLAQKNRWFLRTSVQGSDTKWNLLEIDPATGEALRWIDTSEVPASSVACATDSGFYAVRWIDHKPYLLDGRFQ